MNKMSPGLRLFLQSADIAMLSYWFISGLACLGFWVLPSSLMYDGYGTPLVDAWNWSFAPIDILFAITGLMSIRMARSGDVRWRAMTIISLVLTICAGGMAISYWAILGQFDLSWWLPNLALMTVPLIWLPCLISPDNSAQRSVS